MEPLVYNNDVLSKHSLYAHCASTLNVISERDYPGNNYFDSRIECLDVDTYETSICHGNADCTTDAVIGISTCVNKTMSEHRLLLVELRMRYKSGNNLSKSELEGKVSHTKGLLDGELPIDSNSIFVFTESVAPQARHKIESWKREGGLATGFKVYSVKEFCNNVKSIDDMPYTPIYTLDEVCEELDSFVRTNQWEQMFGKLDFWLRKIENLRYSNTFEFESLQHTIKCWWREFRAKYPIMSNEDDELNALVMEDDIHTVLV